MSALKKLASQTAYYGVSSILARMLNYALVPLHTRVLSNVSDYGIIGELYAYIAFINILFLYGMETAFFRFANKSENAKDIYNKTFSSVFFSTIVFCAVFFLYSSNILNYLSEGDASLYRIEYVWIFICILGLDALSAIPFAKLRLDNRPKKFASIRVANILLNVLLNVYFLIICPWWNQNYTANFFTSFYNSNDAVLYIFICNLMASLLTLVLLYKEILIVKITWAWSEMKSIYLYALPLLFAGLAGMTNETLDRILLKEYLPGELSSRLSQIGIYNAAYKLSIFMTLAVQAFRMAAEPYFFSINKNQDAKYTYAKVMNYFVLVCAIIFLGVSTHLNILAYLLGEQYRSGLDVVPILLMANLFLGIYLNLSIWYKLSDKTMYALYITSIGALLSIGLNILWIPSFGYMAAAYTTLICYFSMCAIAYLFGQKFYPIPYNLFRTFSYIIIALILFIISNAINTYFKDNFILSQITSSFVFIIFLAYALLEFKSRKL